MHRVSILGLLDEFCRLVCGCDPYRVVFKHGLVREQTAPPPRTSPNHTGGPFGDVSVAITLTDSQKVTLTLTVTDKKGNPAVAPPGSVSWFVDNTDLLSITPAADSLSAVLAAVGPIGDGTVSVKIDLDGDGNPEASGSETVSIVAGAPATVTINPGQPEEQ